jgi:hypothetical protein
LHRKDAAGYRVPGMDLDQQWLGIIRRCFEEAMKCIVCHGDQIEIAEVQEAIRVRKDVAYVGGRTPVCRTCGERYYSRQTVRFLEQIERDIEAGNVHVQEIRRVLECEPSRPGT